jgi:methylated-DNA-[protein]-cysteine S-methyltransferase
MKKSAPETSPDAIVFRYDTFSTPAGKFSIAVDRRGAIAAAVFGDVEALRKCLRKRGKHPLERDPGALHHLRRQVDAYFAGSREPFVFELAVEPTPFQDKVWKALRDIPHGETRSYAQLAEAVGSPKASRAVGRANGSNPVCLFVPCHRVIGKDGSLTGYAYGTDCKKKLLEVEARSR